ncbi:hypothetical protein ES703_80868 [subsurface metagenome]
MGTGGGQRIDSHRALGASLSSHSRITPPPGKKVDERGC